MTSPDDELRLDKFQQAWKAEAAQLNVTFDTETLSKEVKQSHDQFRSMIFWRDAREIGVSLLMIPIWFAMGIGLSLPWSWWLTVPALLWVAGFMLVDRKRHPKSSSGPGEPWLFYAKESLTQVEHQIWLLRNVFWWYLLPFSISLMAFFVNVAWNTTGTWWGCCLVTTPFGLFLFFLYRKIYRLNQQAVRDQLEPRRENLRTLVMNLEGDGDAAEVDELVEMVSSFSANDQFMVSKAGAAAWAENWNRIVPSWWIFALIMVPTLVGAYCGYRFAFANAGPVFFQSVVAAVIPFEIMFFGRWYLTSRRYKGQPLMETGTMRVGAPAILTIVLILVISTLAFAAIFAFVSAARSGQPETPHATRLAEKPVTDDGYAKVAPFTDVRWEGDVPIVLVESSWSKLKAINGIEIEEIMLFASKQYGSRARKRFAEDLIEVLATMGHSPDWEVALTLQTDDGEAETKHVRMTSLNRRFTRNAQKWREDLDRHLKEARKNK